MLAKVPQPGPAASQPVSWVKGFSCLGDTTRTWMPLRSLWPSGLCGKWSWNLKGRALTNSYFVATAGGAPLAIIKQYIEAQKRV